MGFKFGPKSIADMEQVHPQLVQAAHFALLNGEVDFGFFEGVRTIEKEVENIKSGASKLKHPEDCMHCLQADGFGHAMDLVPWLLDTSVEKELQEYRFVWDWPACFKIAKLIQQFAFQNDLTIRWGGVWDIPLNKLSVNLEREVEAYKARHKGSDFLDGVHFELPVTNNTSDDVNETAIIA